ncbi:MAG: hypothetical protein INH41_10760, partial [Myxococcaceae bacterium]|nr:hypothetical protein [Myxococcaceae bacterium]
MMRDAAVRALVGSMCLWASAAAAFSSGAPVCEFTTQQMTTSMGATTLTSPGGWSLSTSGLSYGPNQTVTLTLSNTNASQSFKGLLLWAKSASGAFVGSFAAPTGYTTMSGCAPATLTHTSNASKAQRTFTWTAPGPGAGAVTFRAFVVVSSRTTWVELTPLTLAEGSSGTGGGSSGTGGGSSGTGGGSS